MEIWEFRVRVAPRYHNSTHLGRGFSQSSTSSRSLVKVWSMIQTFTEQTSTRFATPKHSLTLRHVWGILQRMMMTLQSKPTQDLDLEWNRSLKHLIYTPNGVEMYCTDQSSSLTPKRFVVVQDYLDTCNRLLDLGPKVIVHAHGKPNLWPANMLHTYIK